MPNRNLTAEELHRANDLLVELRGRLESLSEGDLDLLFAYRRKIYKELSYDERDKPMVRRRLKGLKRVQQGGCCAVCREVLPEKYAVLDRINAVDGYTTENTRLICPNCDAKIQESRHFT